MARVSSRALRLKFDTGWHLKFDRVQLDELGRRSDKFSKFDFLAIFRQGNRAMGWHQLGGLDPIVEAVRMVTVAMSRPGLVCCLIGSQVASTVVLGMGELLRGRRGLVSAAQQRQSGIDSGESTLVRRGDFVASGIIATKRW